MNRRIMTLLSALLLCCAAVTPAAAAQVESDSVYCFAGTDFSEDGTLSGICLTDLPRSEERRVGKECRIGW